MPAPALPQPGIGPFRVRAVLYALGGIILLLAAIGLGRSLGHRLPELEHWIGQQGMVGWLVFILLVVVGTSVFVPDTIFAVMAGVLFGVIEGTVLIAVAALLTASLNFALSRLWLHRLVRRWLTRQPRLAAIEQAVNREGLRFQVLLRLAPLNPVSVSYLLGSTNTRFRTFITASLALVPGLFVEVYFGHVAKHLAQVADDPARHGHGQFLLTVAGLVVCLALLVYLTRVARKAIAQYEQGGSREAPRPISV